MKRQGIPILFLWMVASAAAGDLTTPEGTVDFYLEAQEQMKVEEMAKVRDFEEQARELLMMVASAAPPSRDAVRDAAKELEREFRAPRKVSLPARSCRTGVAAMESSSVARVPVFCSRALGADMPENSAFTVRVSKTPHGWRIVDSAADE